jgi:hypothetical protein
MPARTGADKRANRPTSARTGQMRGTGTNTTTEHLIELSRDGQTLFPVAATSNDPVVRLHRTRKGWSLEAGAPGKYRVTTSRGRTLTVEIASSSKTVDGGWTVRFPAGWDAPASTRFKSLVSWTSSSDPGIRYFSGTATYVKQIEIPVKLLRRNTHFYFELGEVKEIA